MGCTEVVTSSSQLSAASLCVLPNFFAAFLTAVAAEASSLSTVATSAERAARTLATQDRAGMLATKDRAGSADGESAPTRLSLESARLTRAL